MTNRSFLLMMAVLLSMITCTAFAAEDSISLSDLFTSQFKNWHALKPADKPLVVALDTVDNKVGYQFSGNLALTPNRLTWLTDQIDPAISYSKPCELSMFIHNLKTISEIALELESGEGYYLCRIPSSKLKETWNDLTIKTTDWLAIRKPTSLNKITKVRVHLIKKLDQPISVVICAGSSDAQQIDK